MIFSAIYVFILYTLVSIVHCRVVNISNNWMLPEENFPVFYRYFRDRITWHEADAVCQFHHANLVTSDTNSQYDAIRAYLKELDIGENIWIGLSRTVNRPYITWRNFHPLSGDGHWQQPIPDNNEAFCVSMDPAADYLWKPMGCGAPFVASFICELPVPFWAMGTKGCLLTEIPSLTVLYIPEQSALELTSDCGLDGTKRIICKGNADREEILRQLTCGMIDDYNTSSSTPLEVSNEDASINIKTTKPWIWTSNTIDSEYSSPTRHRRETEDTLSPSSTSSTTDFKTSKLNKSTIAPDFVQHTKSLNSNESLELVTQKNEQSFATTEFFYGLPEDQNNDNISSGISLGQLFNVVNENETIFDFDLNLTSTTNLNLQDTATEISVTDSSNVKLASAETNNDNLYTTVLYHKEPPSETSYVTNKSVKKSEHIKEKMLKKKYAKSLKHRLTNDTIIDNVTKFTLTEETLSKENLTEKGDLNNRSIDTVDCSENYKSNKEVESNENTSIIVNDDMLKKSIASKERLLLAETDHITRNKELSPTSNEVVEPEPLVQARPNRQRQLTHPQKRSFYPYFFSRVLG